MVTMEDVRRHLDPEEPDYERAAAVLGPDALPFLAELAVGDDALLAAKAVSLAGLIGGADAIPIVAKAVQDGPAEVRVVAATAAGRAGKPGERLLILLLRDHEVGVRKRAVSAVSAAPSAALRKAVEEVRDSDPHPAVRERAALQLRQMAPAPTRQKPARR